MQINNNNNIKLTSSDIHQEELNLTNKNLELLFDFFDKIISTILLLFSEK